jgi:enolase
MALIRGVIGREVIDSRGNPTVEVEIYTKDSCARAIVPSGASIGSHEAFELRDGGQRFLGKGVLKAIQNVNLLGKKLIGKKLDVSEVDEFLTKQDGTKNKSRFGANAILGISLAAARCLANENNAELYKTFSKLSGNKQLMPNPLFNVINGGMHAGNNLDFQEYLVIPKAKTFRERLQIGSEIYHQLKELLVKKYGRNAVNVGDEGGFAPPLFDAEEPMDLILEAADELGYGKNITLGMDAAANGLKISGQYKLGRKMIKGEELVEYYKDLVASYPISYLEDPISEDDWQNWTELTKTLGRKMHIVGDDLLVTNKERIHKAISLKSCNSLLLKMNQIGTVTEAIEAANLAMKNGFKVIVSHRSGETEDTSIADLSVGLGCGHIKAGAPARGERTAKYNRLLRIEEEL